MKMNEKDAAFMSFIPVEMKMGEDENQNPQALISKLEKVGNRPSPYFSPQGPSKALALTVNALDKTYNICESVTIMACATNGKRKKRVLLLQEAFDFFDDIFVLLDVERYEEIMSGEESPFASRSKETERTYLC